MMPGSSRWSPPWAIGAAAVAVLCSLAVTAPAHAEADDQARAAAALHEQLRRIGSPNAAYAVLDGDRVVTGESGDASQDTPFVIGSLSKSFTAVGVMRAVEAGLVHLDTPATTYLPEFTTASPAGKDITVTHLLHHTSGLSTTDGVRDLLHPDRTLADRVARTRDFELIAPPGQKFEYSNLNYAVLGLLLEKVSGRSYSEYLRDEVLAPIGLTSTVLDVAKAREQGLAAGSVPWFGWWSMPRPESEFPGALPDGYIVSTARDLAAYARFHLGDGRGAAGQVLSAQSMAALHEGIQSTGDTDPTSTGYAMGWYTGESESHPVIRHEGDNFGYRSDIALYPDLDRAIVVLIARNGTLSMAGSPVSAALPALAGGAPALHSTYTVAGAAVLGSAAALALTIGGALLVHRRRAHRQRPPSRAFAVATILIAVLLAASAFTTALLLVGGRITELPLVWRSAPDVMILLIAWPTALIAIGSTSLAQRRRQANRRQGTRRGPG